MYPYTPGYDVHIFAYLQAWRHFLEQGAAMMPGPPVSERPICVAHNAIHADGRPVHAAVYAAPRVSAHSSGATNAPWAGRTARARRLRQAAIQLPSGMAAVPRADDGRHAGIGAGVNCAAAEPAKQRQR